MNDSKRYELLKATGELPSPRGVALAIIRLTQSEAASLNELAQVIKGDPAFTGRLIKAANGSVGLHRRAVVSVQDALMVLGVPAVRAMALGFSLLSDYRQGACKAFDYVGFWARSVLLALAMQQLALRTRVLGADDAFSLGLLARIGELALATLYPEEFAGILQRCEMEPANAQLACEHAELFITHAELGEAMLRDWGLPSQLAAPVRFFQTPELAPFDEDCREAAVMLSLEIAAELADCCLSGDEPSSAVDDALILRAASFGLSREELAAICAAVAQSWPEWRDLLLLEDKPGRPRARPAAGRKAAAAQVAPAAVAAPIDEEARALVASSPFIVLVGSERQDERASLRAILEANGFAVVEEAQAARIVERVIELQPQLAIIDWNNDASEAERVRALRKTRCGRALYLLAVLDGGDEVAMRSAIAAGVDDFIPRPVRASVLRVRVEAGRRLASLQRQLQHESEELRQLTVELSISNRRLEEAAMTDVLTGLPNRRYAVERIQSEWSAAVRYRHPLSVMVVDLDNFKEINDSHGHDVGDMTLRQVADALRSGVRAQDVICRTGGDEFLVICPDSDLQAAVACAERLRHAVNVLGVETGGHGVRVSLSIGVAVRKDGMIAADELIKLADRGAFAAKKRGRNQVFVPQLMGVEP